MDLEHKNIVLLLLQSCIVWCVYHCNRLYWLKQSCVRFRVLMVVLRHEKKHSAFLYNCPGPIMLASDLSWPHHDLIVAFWKGQTQKCDGRKTPLRSPNSRTSSIASLPVVLNGHLFDILWTWTLISLVLFNVVPCLFPSLADVLNWLYKLILPLGSTGSMEF